MDTMTEAERFFYEHAGWSWDPATETEEEGRLRCARELAAAEARLKAGPFYVGWVPDDVPWDGDVPYDGPLWIVQLWSVADSAGPELLGAIGSVAEEDGGPYLRVVAAELADQYIKGES